MAFYGVPMGADFLVSVVAGFEARFDDPLQLARVEIIANSARTARNLYEEFLTKIRISPRIFTLDQYLEQYRHAAQTPLPSEISHVLGVATLLRQVDQELLPIDPAHIFELAFHLVDLMNSCAEHGRSFEDLLDLPLDDYAEHWKLNASLFKILMEFWARMDGDFAAQRVRDKINALETLWQAHPPDHPVFVVGSTGSRPNMRAMMRLVEARALGGVVLPAVDFAPQADLGEDHPQYGMQNLLQCFGEEGFDASLHPWAGEAGSISEFLHEALAPPPYTDRWLESLDHVQAMLEAAPLELHWLESKTAHDEVRALCALVYEAQKNNQSVAIVSNDRAIVRNLSLRLEVLGIDYDDSAGKPLALAPSAVFAALLLDAVLVKDRVRAVAFLSHPFVDKPARQAHLQALRFYEKNWLRDVHDARAWRADPEDDRFASIGGWITKWRGFFDQPVPTLQSLSAWIEWHLQRMDIASGVEGGWQALGGAEKGDLDLFGAMEALAAASHDDTKISARDYQHFWNAWLQREPAIALTRDSQAPVRFLGKLEARSERADWMVFAAMNEGQWPDAEIPDMWLNRDMRKRLGLETPERFVGLSGHDFVTGFSAPRLVLSRAQQSGDASNIESRFLTRLRVLMSGASKGYFDQSKARGAHWVKLGDQMDRPERLIDFEPRPAIAVPLSMRPTKYRVTAIENMLKNPYRAYAEFTLGLRALSPLGDAFGAREQGVLAHRVFEQQAPDLDDPVQPLTDEAFEASIQRVIDEEGLDPVDRFEVENIFARIKPLFLEEENKRREWAHRVVVEALKEQKVQAGGYQMTLRARFDRLDQNADGDWRLYDYKSGAAPYNTVKFDPQKAVQLPLMAMMQENETSTPPDEVAVLKYKHPKTTLTVPLVGYDGEKFQGEFARFLKAYYAEGFAFEAAFQPQGHDDAYEHLSRFGEWLESDHPVRVEVSHE